MSAAVATLARNRYVPPMLGVLSLVVVVALIGLLIRVGMINRFIVPMPSDIIAAFPLEIAGVSKSERRERARHFVNLVGLAGFERRYPAELSGGMRQRVSMARTLASEPKILLMDEPFAALDEQTRLLLGDKVLQIQQDLKQTTLLITHNITEAVQLSDRILVMTYRPGRVKRVVTIDLPRPRTSEIVSSDAFGHCVAQIWSDLREEATRGMQDAEAHSLRAGGHS